MTSRVRSIMVVLAALVAGTLLIVHVLWPSQSAARPPMASQARHEVSVMQGNGPMTAANESAMPKSEPAPSPSLPASPPSVPVPPSATTPKPTQPAPPPAGAEAPKVLYDLNALPGPIKRMLEHIVDAAQGGNIDDMLPVLQENELPPMLGTDAVGDPIAFWKKVSADGQGHDILAALLNVFSSGYVKKGDGKSAQYIWPYFAEIDLTKLTPSQQVELYRIVPAARAIEMQKTGKYDYYRAGIGNDGVWHYFMQQAGRSR